MKRVALLVEDEPDTRDLLSRALVREGYHCLAASGPDDALDLAKTVSFVSVVITDVVMGGNDRAGLELLPSLRAIGVRAPVVLMTAFVDIEKLKTAINEGVGHFLEKPFRAAELISAATRACARSSTEHAIDEVLSRARVTDKERSVARRLLEGLSSREIALLENNSEKTIRQHLTQIYAKCEVSGRAELFHKVFAR